VRVSDDGEGQASATATADPYGMTTKRAQATANPYGMTTKRQMQTQIPGGNDNQKGKREKQILRFAQDDNSLEMLPHGGLW